MGRKSGIWEPETSVRGASRRHTGEGEKVPCPVVLSPEEQDFVFTWLLQQDEQVFFLDVKRNRKARRPSTLPWDPKEGRVRKGLEGKQSGKLEGGPGFRQSEEKGEGPSEKVEDTGGWALWSSSSRGNTGKGWQVRGGWASDREVQRTSGMTVHWVTGIVPPTCPLCFARWLLASAEA